MALDIDMEQNRERSGQKMQKVFETFWSQVMDPYVFPQDGRWTPISSDNCFCYHTSCLTVLQKLARVPMTCTPTHLGDQWMSLGSHWGVAA